MVRRYSSSIPPTLVLMLCRSGGSEPDKVVWKKAYKLYVQAFDAPSTPSDQKKLARLLKTRLPEHLHNQVFTYDGFLQGLGRMALSTYTPFASSFCKRSC